MKEKSYGGVNHVMMWLSVIDTSIDIFHNLQM